MATRFVGSYYSNGMYGLPQDDTKALELWHRAAEFGNVTAYFKIGCNYVNGQGRRLSITLSLGLWEEI